MSFSSDFINAQTQFINLSIYQKYVQDNTKLEKLMKEIDSLHKEYLKDIKNIVLIALKKYTEGEASWERASEICGLSRWELEKYCEDKGVETAYLRIDEGYGITDIQLVKKEWEKLDPSHTMYPIRWTGKSKFISRSIGEITLNNVYEKLWTNKNKYLLGEVVCEISRYIRLLDTTDNRFNTKDDIDYSIVLDYYGKLNKIIDGLWVFNEYDAIKLEYLIENLKKDLKGAYINKSIIEMYSLLNDFFKLFDYGYYFITIKH